MSTKEANIALISILPDEDQEKIFLFLSENFCDDNPYKLMSAAEIAAALSESRDCFKRGEYQDFDKVLDDISKKYGL